MSLAIESFEQINLNAQPYPGFLLPHGGSALCLFAAGFLGWNDVIHMVRRKMTVDCVDTNANNLWEMATLYPEGLAFHVDDAWDFAERAAAEGRQWDVVSVDPFFGDAAEKAWETLYLWTSLARDLVTLTVKASTQLNPPDGWTSYFFPRNERAAWMVMKRA